MIKRRLSNLIATMTFLVLALSTKIYRGPGVDLVHHYLGDLFIVTSLFFFISMFLRQPKPWCVAALVFSVASAVELAQLSDLFSPAVPSMISFWLGSTFDPFDLIAYALGAALAVAITVGLTQRTR